MWSLRKKVTFTKKGKKAIRILICSKNDFNNGKIADFLLKAGYNTHTCIGLEQIASHRSWNPHIILLFHVIKFTIDQKELTQTIQYVKTQLPQTKIIAASTQHEGQLYTNAGVDAYHSIEGQFFHKGSGKYIQGLGDDPTSIKLSPWSTHSTAGIGSLDKVLLVEQIRSLVTIEKEDQQALETEKSTFYNNAKDLFLLRSTQTANSKAEIGFIDSQLRRFRAGSILDCGCGMGRLTIPLAQKGYNITGIDIADELLFKARKDAEKQQLQVSFEKRSAVQSGFTNQQFDAVLIMWHTICEFRNNRSELLREAARILHPGGILIFDFPDISKNKHIPKNGKYQDDTPFGKYLGQVPQIKQMLLELTSMGLSDIEFKKVTWGIPKFVIIARGYGFT